MECVPLYDTLGEHAIEFIMNHRWVHILVSASTLCSVFVV
jgi:hypothetical protein